MLLDEFYSLVILCRTCLFCLLSGPSLLQTIYLSLHCFERARSVVERPSDFAFLPPSLQLNLEMASKGTLRLLTNLPKASTRSQTPLAFFQPSSTSFRSLPFFYPSRQPVAPLRSHNSYFTPCTPSHTFTSLRTAFHSSSRPSPHPPSSFASLQRSFSTTRVTKGIRPYYGRGGNGGGSGRGPGGWKDRINSVEQVWILGGLLGEPES